MNALFRKLKVIETIMSKGDKTDVPRSRGNRLARRARSFKEDLLEKITQMRSPSSTRASSPHKNKHSGRAHVQSDEGVGKKSPPEKNMIILQKDVQNALRYLNDVIEKDKLEMLPGSASAVLDSIHNVLRNCLSNEQSSVLVSSMNQVYQSLANLIRWSDVVLVSGDKALDKNSIKEVIGAVDKAVKNLVGLVIEKLNIKEVGNGCVPGGHSMQNGMQLSKKNDCASASNLPLSKRELEILQTTTIPSATTLGHSISSDSILNATHVGSEHLDLPPPKPPLPDSRDAFRSTGCLLDNGGEEVHPPALPPKRRLHSTAYNPGTQLPSTTSPFESSDTLDDWPTRKLTVGRDWSSPTRRSPASVSPLSVSASSLDSTPNRSSDDLLADVKWDFHSNFELLNNSHATYHESHSRSNVTTSTWSDKKVFELDSIERRMKGLSCYTQSSSSGVFSMSSMNEHQSEKSVSTMATVSSASCMVQENSSFIVNQTTEEPPAIPPKRRGAARNRTPSQYDNIPEQGLDESWNAADSSSPPCGSPNFQSQLMSSFTSGLLSPAFDPNAKTSLDSGQPPPLPPKKKHVMAYMQMFGSCTQHSVSDMPYSNTVHSYNFQHHEMSITRRMTTAVSLVSSSDDSVFSDSMNGSFDSFVSEDNNLMVPPPALPPKRMRSMRQNKVSTNSIPPRSESEGMICQLPNTKSQFLVGQCQDVLDEPENQNNFLAIEAPPVHGNFGVNNCHKVIPSGDVTEFNILDELDVKSYLVYKKEGEDGPEIRGGSIDSLIVNATMASKNDFMYQEAFLTTYRTFVSLNDLINKLLYRYNKFAHMTDVSRQRIARNAFSLLVRVVDDFSLGDLTDEILQVLVEFVFQLLCNGDLMLARALRKKLLEKYWIKRNTNNLQSPLSSKSISTKLSELLDFKSEQLAEQMTLLDADLFQKIEIPEVLIWARLQKEELSVNLTTFTEHFNKMSYWARSRILEQEDAKDRERYVVKFIKIMKYLRKMNNFNSYLAILSALDSAPIRRLEWQKHITEGLKEYCELIDSSSSFRAYRQALAETEPPCIPYIGLILQDLTFVHIGNSDLLLDGSINFSKRWQQFNILDNMRRFKKCQFDFKTSERIIAFFNNFDDHLCEEAMWQISEGIKPRAGRKKPD